MSKKYENNLGIYISHECFINDLYKEINYKINPDLFSIFKQYKSIQVSSKSKNKKQFELSEENEFSESNEIKLKFDKFIKDYLCSVNYQYSDLNNDKALQCVDIIKKNSPQSALDLIGGNIGSAIVKEINDSNYLFPHNCTFFSKDVAEMSKYLVDKKFDLILLDPPWWNKYIRRKRKASSDAYKMMYNHNLKDIPIKDLLTDDGLVAVWCTNSEQNTNALINDIFPHWGVNFTGKWYWVKVTLGGKPICDFSKPPGKQPYEKIIFGHRKRTLPLPIDGKLLVSVPSAIHSHKPPLVDVLKEFLPENPVCLEVFARYLLPNWTSYGNEVLKLQHENLYKF